MIVELDKDNLSEVIANNDNVVVQYSASWCGNCRIMKPKFKKEASLNEDIKFVMVDAEKFPESRKLANVDNLPTFAAFSKGALKNQVQTNKYDVLKDSDALVLLTEWKEFRSPNFEKIKAQLKKPVIFDGRNQYITHDLENKGFEYYRIGKI